MLVLSRFAGQKIIIDDNIELQVISIRGGAVKLGITAPPSVKIIRSELGIFGTAKRGRGQGEAPGMNAAPCGEHAAALGSEERRAA